MNKIKYLSLVCTILSLTACSNIQTPESSNDKNQQQTNPVDEIKPTEQLKQEKPQVTKVDKVSDVSPAVISLITQAKQQSKSGNTNAAMSSLERAIRIAPRYPESYYQLGEIHYQQGDKLQARSLAQKAITLGASGQVREQALKLIGKSAM